jgi:hypothetical protein
VKVQVPGQHRWPDAPEEVAFLRHDHRHLFGIVAEWEVDHGNRAIEFFLAQQKVHQLLLALWPIHRVVVDFGAMSCEDIAERLLLSLRPHPRRVTVSEDGENEGVAEAL